MRSANIAKRLLDAGHTISVLTTSGGRAACTQLGLNADYQEVRAGLFFSKETHLWQRAASYAIAIVFSIFEIPRLPSVDIIYSDSDYPCDVIPAIAYRSLRGGRWVAMVHHLIEAEQENPKRGLLSRFKQAVQRWGHRLIGLHADAVFVYKSLAGDHVASYLERCGLDKRKLARVHNGIDEQALAEIEPSDLTYDACLVGHLRPGKGLYEVIPIWRKVVERRPLAQLAIIGLIADNERKQFITEIAKYGLEANIFLLGQRSHGDTVSVVKASSIMVTASLEEGWGIAVCEALACAIPVVGYDLPAYRSLFQDGLISVAVRDHDAFAAAVCDLLADEDLRFTLGAQGRSAVQKYDWAHAASAEETLFHTVYERRRFLPTSQ